MPHHNRLFAIRFEENSSASARWKLYLASVETGKFTICAQKVDGGSSATFQALSKEACVLFVENLLWASSVETSLLVVPERVFMRGFQALEEACAEDQMETLSSFDGVLSRDEIQEYVKQVCDVSVI